MASYSFISHWNILTYVILVGKVNAIYYTPQIFSICGRPFVNSSVPIRTHAEIHSPGYPGVYFGPYQCSLSIKLPELSWISVSTLRFEMKRPRAGCDDSVLIRNRDKPDDRSLRCGNISEHQLIFQDSTFSLEGNIDVIFHAKTFPANLGDAEPQRFVLEYIVADYIYPGENLNHSKAVVSHGYGYIVSHSSYTGLVEDSYDNSIDSYFTLTDFEKNSVVEIHFLSFQLHNDLNCSDYLNITGISEDQYHEQPLKLCGNEADNTAYIITTIDTSITFHFKTGEWSNHPGFQIQYHVHGLASDSATFSSVFTQETPETSSQPDNGTHTEEEAQKSGLRESDYMYLGIGIGVNVFVAIIVITVVVILVKRKRRLARADNVSNNTDSTQRVGPSPSNYKTDRGIANAGSTADFYDDESAYYSEIGTFQKPANNDEIHYASRSICNTDFYHVVEEPQAQPMNYYQHNYRPEAHYHTPRSHPPNNASNSRGNDRLPDVPASLEYNQSPWGHNHGSRRF